MCSILSSTERQCLHSRHRTTGTASIVGASFKMLFMIKRATALKFMFILCLSSFASASINRISFTYILIGDVLPTIIFIRKLWMIKLRGALLCIWVGKNVSGKANHVPPSSLKLATFILAESNKPIGKPIRRFKIRSFRSAHKTRMFPLFDFDFFSHIIHRPFKNTDAK